MKFRLRHLLPLLAVLSGLLMLISPSSSQTVSVTLGTQLSSQTEADYNSFPISTTQSATPLVMLAMSRDEQLYAKAYSDYTDLDANGSIDATYNNNFDYSGYFDPQLCYGYGGSYTDTNYNGSNDYFAAAGTASNHRCTGLWSGNFLNWLAMSRLDALRFVLYGGYRSTDNAGSETILERAYIPQDTHSWVKVYGGSDLDDFTPLTSFSGSMSFCNTTLTASNSATGTEAPIIRVADGRFTEWAATEGKQCQWRGSDTSYAANNKPSDTAGSQTTGPVCPYSDSSQCSSSVRTNQLSCPAGFEGYCSTATATAQVCPAGASDCQTTQYTAQPTCPSGYNTCRQISHSGEPTCPPGFGSNCTTISNTAPNDCPSGGYACTTEHLTQQPTCPSGGYVCTDIFKTNQASCPFSDTQYCTTIPHSYSTLVACQDAAGNNFSCTASVIYASSCADQTGDCVRENHIAVSANKNTYNNNQLCATVNTRAISGTCNVNLGNNHNNTCKTSGNTRTCYYDSYKITSYIYYTYDYHEFSYDRVTYNTYNYFEYSYTQSSYTVYNYTQYSYNTTDKIGEFTARVKVCDPAASAQETFCRRTYVNSSNVTSMKPAGLLQKYGETGKIKFGLVTGSYSKPRAGGQLRRNVSKLAGNVAGSNCGSGSGDEINLLTGQFCTNNTEGIIKTLNVVRQPGWNGSGYNVNSDCDNYGILNRSAGGNGYLKDPGDASGKTCAGWGNPLAEIYAEAVRYLQGNGHTATSDYAGNDTTLISGIPNGVSWQDPYDRNNWCAYCAIIMLSTGIGSFDTDQIPNSTALNGIDAVAATVAVGANEGINNSSYLIGRTSALSNTTYTDLCQARSIPDLSQAIGICPEAPSLEGGYNLAGIAWKAWTTDQRPDLAATSTLAGKPSNYINRFQTYAISLAESLPTYEIPLSSGAIALSPLCQSNNSGTTSDVRDGNGRPTDTSAKAWRSCGFLSLTVGPRTATISPNYIYGRDTVYDSEGRQRAGSFSVVWEDSTWGNDHDLDGSSMISFCVGNTCSTATNGQGSSAQGICWNVASNDVCDGSGNLKSSVTLDDNTLLVRVEALSVYAGNSLLFGFSTSGAATSTDTITSSSGTTVNGAHRLFVRPGCNISTTLTANDSVLTAHASPLVGYNNTGNCTWSAPQVVKFTGGAPVAGSLQNPLFYAAKYGGFTIPAAAPANPLPSAPSAASHGDWDSINNDSGAKTPDGLPDNYFRVRNPSQLAKQLDKVLQSILAQTASGTAAAVVANAVEGEGAVYQALFDSSKTDSANRIGSWIGTLQAFFIDQRGRLREDGNASLAGNGLLDESDFTKDPVVQIYYDADARRSKVRRYTTDPSAAGATPSVAELESLKPLWNARRRLSEVSNPTTQRNYGQPASGSRYILTFVDNNLNGVVDSGEITDFVPSSFTGNKYGLLNVPSASDADYLVRYIRGEEVLGLRNRTVDYDGDGTAEVQRLGDIVQSTPTAVGSPSEGLSTLYSDQTYSAFVTQYRNRRTVIYVGGNDGMIHAFNGGFYDATVKGFKTQRTNDDVVHPLGSELWAYVPYNLLPHLRWLTNPEYSHVYYMDGKPRVFDARIFPTDTVHPYGWGTVMVVGMRLGGGNIQVPTTNTAAFSGLSGMSTSVTSLPFRSAYVLMDVTDPESPPTVIAEITDPNGGLGFTTSFPTAFSFGQRENTVSDYLQEQWYLTFGAGPRSLSLATTTQNAALYVYDLINKAFVSGYAPLQLTDSGGSALAPASFIGDPVSVDWDRDNKSDALYFGTVGGNAASPSGKLFKMDLRENSNPSQWLAPRVLTDPGAPIGARPTVSLDESQNRWVYAGTGRFFINDDKSSTAQQYLFGVIDDPATTTTVPFSGLVNTTAAKVSTQGAVQGVTGATSQTQLIALAANSSHKGWKIQLNTNSGQSAERVVTNTSLLGEVLFSAAFTPSQTLCEGEGSSRLFGLYYKTGAANANRPSLGTRTTTINGDSTATESVGVVSLGSGNAASVALHLGGATAGSAGGSSNDPGGGGSTGAAGCGVASAEVTAINQTSVASIAQTITKIAPGACSGELDWRDSRRDLGN